MDTNHERELRERLRNDPEALFDVIKGGEEGHDAFLRDMLAVGADPNGRDYLERPALSVAAHRGSHRAIELLINAGADVNATDADGRTALMVAARHGVVDSIDPLIKHGADVTARDANGETALMLAVRSEAHKSAEILRSYENACVQARDLNATLPKIRDPMNRPAEDMSAFRPGPTLARSTRRRL
jgi:ankyrin repeat protein